MKQEHVIKQQGKDFVLYAGLLDEAHAHGLRMIRTQLIQAPTEANGQTAICSAEVEMRPDPDGDPRFFTGIGDASPASVNRMIAPHIIRMAETRAKARALRDAVNIGMTAAEELGGDDADEAPRPIRRTSYTPQNPQRELRASNDEFTGEVLGDDLPFEDEAPVPGDASPKPAGYAQRQANAERAQFNGPPASEKQIATIQKMSRGTINTEGLTRAKASEIISGLIAQKGEGR